MGFGEEISQVRSIVLFSRPLGFGLAVIIRHMELINHEARYIYSLN